MLPSTNSSGSASTGANAEGQDFFVALAAAIGWNYDRLQIWAMAWLHDAMAGGWRKPPGDDMLIIKPEEDKTHGRMRPQCSTTSNEADGITGRTDTSTRYSSTPSVESEGASVRDR